MFLAKFTWAPDETVIESEADRKEVRKQHRQLVDDLKNFMKAKNLTLQRCRRRNGS